ncbi:hypothetical protein JTE90_023983 [Oedothorax gibbosus]|uniref:Uncharacterized protein n=1 Tax=Oedothorax gibbosus TaxID=931172 RepID=A0AAV6UGK6_9ARAC|nr:hypothetical protein JTE90_023983 [Oedothorax gibbosus]
MRNLINIYTKSHFFKNSLLHVPKPKMSNQLISLLYDAVLRNDVCSNAVTETEIKSAIKNMTEVYKPRLNSLSSTEKHLADYNTVAYRCAYLHKYAAFHSAIVRDVLVTVLNQDRDFFRSLYDKLTTSMLKICSLGGGPGSDIVGIVAALSQIASFQCSAKVVDLKADWEHTLGSVVHELRCRDYGLLGQCFQVENFRWEYLMADLLENEVEDNVTGAIGDADWVTMVKFVSAASCKSTESMLLKIFSMLKSGSMVLFIDNASGGFSELVSTVSKKCNMTYVFGPINHKIYTSEELKRSLFSYTSCFSTTLTIHLMEKQGPNRESNFTVDQAGWVRENYSIEDQAGWKTDSDFMIDQSGWISQMHPIAQSRWMKEKNPFEDQEGWNRAPGYTMDQSVWINETPFVPQVECNADFTIDPSEFFIEERPIAQTVWDRDYREPQPLLPLSVWDRDYREPQPLLPLSVWDREPKPLLPLPLWDCESKPLPVWDNEPRPLLPLPVWGRQSNWDVDSKQAGWNIKQNPNVDRSRWNRGKLSHCGSIKMRQRNKFKRGRSINIGFKKKFHNNLIQIKQQIKSNMRL